MRVAAIVPAAGKGRRIKSKIDKPYIGLCGKPILAHTLLKLSGNRHIAEIIVAADKKRISALRHIIRRFRIKKVKVVAGGKERKTSVFNALKNVSSKIDYVLIHDGIRPFISNRLIDASLKAARRFGSCIVAVPVKPTLKYLGRTGRVQHTPDRRAFWEAQTPQVFRRALIEKAYKKAGRKKINITDDSMLVERLGVKPRVILGSYNNIKITTPEDLELARILCRGRNRK
ncbi:MAG: 2-C-methyl-D-erythritol 4-phosphate cytidylyltransferase [Candidatus Omnitrophica bacterium]|nr:2-C-methyl-D-erythritol 4-phosphate cytidylyltransferase [Candidatus Omnitrophota bacterium]